ncbi:MAG: hypothetical protein QNJ12_11650 [Ilumatobacter sp.]|uniref:hypothetical protein n=1 Tax=Ilumatobacter sp. TaxID=1967498 RepID=UPI00262BBC13|nr:hypothetical protein [Ilumatobacter sp.]MDJ0769444.1 hypothetical protein [Ilumatobacter sp.]
MRRVTWFVTGVAAGAAGASYATRKVKETASQLAPANVARGAAKRARKRGRQVVEAVREGRVAMRAREDELKARRDARVKTLDDQLEPGDQLYVDGQPVETGRVIVLKKK